MKAQISTYKANIIVSVISIITGCWFFYDSLNIPKTMGKGSIIGPASLPIAISILFVFTGAILLFRSLASKDLTKINFFKINRILIFSGILFLYVLALEFFNFYLVTLVSFPLLLLTARVKRLSVIIFITALFLAFAYLGFELLLNVPLP